MSEPLIPPDVARLIHELNNQLAIAIGMSELLATEAVEAGRDATMLTEIRSACERAAQLLEDWYKKYAAPPL